jgi:hypothetical protein
MEFSKASLITTSLAAEAGVEAPQKTSNAKEKTVVKTKKPIFLSFMTKSPFLGFLFCKSQTALSVRLVSS